MDLPTEATAPTADVDTADVDTAGVATTGVATTDAVVAPAGLSREDVLRDYELGWVSRHVSLISRREVLTGKAKFGIFGDGKEVPQLAMARAFRPGDFRSGYYRDQTFALAAGIHTVDELYAQLYADPDPVREPASAGRQMNAHFASRLLDDEGRFRDQTASRNCAADASPTGSQMPRLVGLAWASKLYREVPGLAAAAPGFTRNGDEIAFGTIGNASCAEGMFWESVNAVGVLGAPMLLSIWDDEYGISVHNRDQVTKGDLGELLSGFERRDGRGGFEVHRVAGWDYPRLVELYAEVAARMRAAHVPAILHVVELTQPQGHSTSGSQERYKTEERLEWERRHDCLVRMRQWIAASGLASADELAAIEARAQAEARAARQRAWDAFMDPVRADGRELAARLAVAAEANPAAGEALRKVAADLERVPALLRRHLMSASHEALRLLRDAPDAAREALVDWRHEQTRLGRDRYSSHLVSEAPTSPLHVAEVAPVYAEDAPVLNGFEVLNRAFDTILARDPRVIAFGEDVGRLGDVNQGMLGLQEKHGALRVSDTGIRETTILGQAIGVALRGLRPIAEIQYLDYVLYALQTLSDDLATLRYRTKGGQAAPVIVRTRGHRLEGIWHSGSPMAALLALLRGVWICVPRDMTRAAGLYNTLLDGDDPAIVVEVLNGYRIKERLPANLGELRIPLGVPEVLRAGSDVTVVTYGACCRVAAEAADLLAAAGIDVELIDVQTLLPFDRPGVVGRSLRKTHRVLFLDEDVPGGTTAYLMQQVLEGQDGYAWLDGPPRTLSAPPHRPAYGSDGDYFSKPQVEHVYDAVTELMHEAQPRRFPLFFR